MRHEIKVLTTAKPIYKIHCGECNWELLITANTDESVKCCPWCGWRDLELVTLRNQGLFRKLNAKNTVK
ncbi:Uncharacterised protein [Budvicia aquatica]|uniref:Uncharacterized protein n=1 Tax=Budvicia aquatica TaxID=82979 RepID=A0A484ZMR2_9GAMM|nr:Uncharacterised protein [Budvicia aquatica]